MDGTLVDSNGAHVEAWAEAFRRHGLRPARRALHRQIGKGGDKYVAAVAGQQVERAQGDSIRDAHGAAFRRIARRRRLPVLPGAEAFIARLRAQGHAVALATSSADEQLDLLFESCGTDFRRLADHHTTADDADASKPEPDIITAALHRLGAAPRDAVMVGDTTWDAVAARHAGVFMLGVETGGTRRPALERAGAVQAWPDLPALNAALPMFVDRLGMP